jgi:hypothetical protein
MRFFDLRTGDFFEAHGATFQKLPALRAPDLPEVNAINMATRRLAFFGATVPVDFVKRGDLDLDGGKLQLLVAMNPQRPDRSPLTWRVFCFS